MLKNRAEYDQKKAEKISASKQTDSQTSSENMVLANYINAKGKLSLDEQQELASKMVTKAVICGVPFNAISINFAVANEVDFSPYENEKHAMYAFIRHEKGDDALTPENTAVFWHDDTFPEAQTDCCIIISGRMEGQPDCKAVFGKYMKDESSASDDSISPQIILASMVAKGDKYFLEKEYKKAADAYESALMFSGGNNFELGRKLCTVYLMTDRMQILPIISHMINFHGESAMTGIDYAFFAIGLYAYMNGDKEDELEKEIQRIYHMSAKQLMLKLINDAKEHGVDHDDFQEMEKYAKKGKGGFGGLFRRKK